MSTVTDLVAVLCPAIAHGIELGDPMAWARRVHTLPETGRQWWAEHQND